MHYHDPSKQLTFLPHSTRGVEETSVPEIAFIQLGWAAHVLSQKQTPKKLLKWILENTTGWTAENRATLKDLELWLRAACIKGTSGAESCMAKSWPNVDMMAEHMEDWIEQRLTTTLRHQPAALPPPIVKQILPLPSHSPWTQATSPAVTPVTALSALDEAYLKGTEAG